MSDLASAKTLGGLGSIFVLLLLVPYAGGVLAIAGWIMILFALKRISDYGNDGSIFNNALIAAILSIIGVVVGVVLVIGSLLRFIGLNGYAFGTAPPPTTVPTDIFGLIFGVLIGLVVLWIFGIVSSIFLRMSLDKVSKVVNVKMFSTAALLYLIGAVLTIILVGFLLIFVAEILFIVAFFSIPDNPPMGSAGQQGSGPPPMAPAPAQTV